MKYAPSHLAVDQNDPHDEVEQNLDEVERQLRRVHAAKLMPEEPIPTNTKTPRVRAASAKDPVPGASMYHPVTGRRCGMNYLGEPIESTYTNFGLSCIKDGVL
jgi:hypothetical protein